MHSNQIKYIPTASKITFSSASQWMIRTPQAPPPPPPPKTYHWRLTPDQIATLEAQFNKSKTLHSTDLSLLAFEMAADERDVQGWYTHRVATWRREQGLSDCFGQI